MANIIINILSAATSISASLIVVLGSLVVLCLLLYPIYFLLNNVLYKRTKASIYFIYYIKHRKDFIKYFNENKPNVFTPRIKE